MGYTDRIKIFASFYLDPHMQKLVVALINCPDLLGHGLSSDMGERSEGYLSIH